MHLRDGIDCLESRSRYPEGTRYVSGASFGWMAADHGPDGLAIHRDDLDGGLFRADTGTSGPGGARVVPGCGHPEAGPRTVEAAGGRGLKPPVTFPGGPRFHFVEPGGNRLAVRPDRDA